MTGAPATYAQVDRTHQECIEECSTCHHICLLTSSYCLSQGGRYLGQSLLTLLADCADMCQTTAKLLLRRSEQHAAACAATAAICRACAEACATLRDDYHLRECADACRRCAGACEKMAAEEKTH